MRFTIITAIAMLGLTAMGMPSQDKRDKFEPCSVFGSNCAVQDQEFCDPETGKISVCHKFGSDCWVRYTQEACAAKEKRDKFDSCSVFGDNCVVDGNEWCDGTQKVICHQIPFTDDCWVRNTNIAC
ncbi:uncharacterized protein BDR25DRAFT_338400 [Lindgomyces ingoldianus]|uniref:Uncharacterized protein n=1 Tax=Lindgomyces ingoldianus TaxID=673940 RepID=A0ACB6REV3_9PLEO|nr:uncharacterized protein BDR25DRAFT_338400 [Lindgomyces ingoldianus]KAF2477585.1 hypothetical protein BDR25DRAFT_338400 [Lindgomyces ingoldianus]